MVPHQGDEANVDRFIRHAMPSADMSMNMFLSSLAFNVCLILFFYFHHYYLFDRFVVTGRYITYVGIVAASFTIIFFSARMIKRLMFDTLPFMLKPVSFHEFVRAFTWFLLVLIVGIGIKLLT